MIGRILSYEKNEIYVWLNSKVHDLECQILNDDVNINKNHDNEENEKELLCK